MWITIAMHRVLRLLALGAFFASAAFGQVGAGTGAGGGAGSVDEEILPGDDQAPAMPHAGAAKPKFLVAYTARGVTRPLSHELTIDAGGSAKLVMRDGATAKTAVGRLEAEEVAGLDDALAEFFAAPEGLTPLVGQDGVDRIVAFEKAGLRRTRGANRDDAATRAMTGRLDALAAMVKGGLLDDARKRFEAKLARPDRGVHAATVTTLLASPARYVRFEIDAAGRRAVTRSCILDASAAAALPELVETILPPPRRPVTGGVAARPSAAVARLWNPIRDQIHAHPAALADGAAFVEIDLLRDVRPGLPGLAIVAELLVR